MIDESTIMVMELSQPEIERLRASVVYSAKSVIRRARATLLKGKMYPSIAQTCLDRLDKIPTLLWKSGARDASEMHADIRKLRKELKACLKKETPHG